MAEHSENQTVEIEEKYFLSPADYIVLQRIATLLTPERKKFRDVYFDTSSYTLTLQDWWLRRRGDTYELKLPTSAKDACAYEEVCDEQTILQRLQELYLRSFTMAYTDAVSTGWPSAVAALLVEDADNSQSGVDGGEDALPGELLLVPFCDLQTERESFSTMDPTVRVDVDVVRFRSNSASSAEFSDANMFSICEFEVMASSGDATTVEQAKARIQSERVRMGLGHCAEGHSKVLEYLARHSPHHYSVLAEKWKA